MKRGVGGVLRGPGGRQGGVKVSQGVKKGVRSVPGVKGSLGDPRGLRGVSEVYPGAQGIARDI